MKILVTGGAGFIGSHVVDAYVRAGHQVVVLDDLSSGKVTNLNPEARFYKADVCFREIEEIFQAERFDVVNHHAAQVDLRQSVVDPVEDARINVLGGVNVLHLAARHGVPHFIFASTGGAIYGEASIPTAESHPANPISPYGVAKLAVEKYLHAFHVAHGLRYLVLRYANVYGPRQDSCGEAGVVALFCRRILAGEPPVVFGDGEQTRDFVYVGDVARANVLALHRLTCSVLNVGTGIESSVNELLDQVQTVAGVKTRARHESPRAGELRRSALNPKRARDLFGWTHQVGLRDGLRQTFEWFAQGNLSRV